MPQEEKILNIFKWAFWTTVFVYLLINFSTPPDPRSLEQFKVSALQLRLLGLTITVPLLLIWVAGLYAALRFKKYALKIEESKEGSGLNAIANGLMMLVISLPASSLFSGIATYLVRGDETLRPMTTVLRNYANLVLPMIAYYYMWKGSKGLLASLKEKVKPNLILPAVLIVAAAFVYIYALFNDVNRTVPTTPHATSATFYLEDPVIIVTVMLPTIIFWFFAFAAAVNLYSYQKYVPGILYKKSLRYLSYGIFSIIVLNTLLRLLTLFSESILALGLGGILIVVYILLLLIAVGYLFIFVGAKKLTKIEEVAR